MQRQFISQNVITIRNGNAAQSVAIKPTKKDGKRIVISKNHETLDTILVKIFSSPSHKVPISIADIETPTEITKKPILATTSSYDGTPYSYPTGQAELSLLKVVVPANEPLPPHKHPMPNVGYVLSGSIVLVNEETKEERIYHAGEGIPEMVGTRHRGKAQGEPCVLIVFYAGVVGQELSEP